jgi:hypothetical protein
VNRAGVAVRRELQGGEAERIRLVGGAVARGAIGFRRDRVPAPRRHLGHADDTVVGRERRIGTIRIPDVARKDPGIGGGLPQHPGFDGLLPPRELLPDLRAHREVPGLFVAAVDGGSFRKPDPSTLVETVGPEWVLRRERPAAWVHLADVAGEVEPGSRQELRRHRIHEQITGGPARCLQRHRQHPGSKGDACRTPHVRVHRPASGGSIG